MTSAVLVAGTPPVEYRPYSKTCPSQPPPDQVKRWVTEEVCGTVETYTFMVYLTSQYGGTQRVTETRYVLPGFAPVSTYSGLPYTGWTMVPGSLKLVSSAPYCKTVKVYE